MDRKFLFALLAAAIILISGCATPYDGSPPKVVQSRIDAVTASATAWLASAQGKELFPGGIFASPLAVFDENRSFEHWVLPVKDGNNMYIGFLITKNDGFTVPELGATKYPDPRHNLFSKTKDDAYSQMLSEHVYTTDQVKEPYISIVEGKGYQWTSEVVINGKHAARLLAPISIIVPSDVDKKGPGL